MLKSKTFEPVRGSCEVKEALGTGGVKVKFQVAPGVEPTEFLAMTYQELEPV